MEEGFLMGYMCQLRIFHDLYLDPAKNELTQEPPVANTSTNAPLKWDKSQPCCRSLYKSRLHVKYKRIQTCAISTVRETLITATSSVCF